MSKWRCPLSIHKVQEGELQPWLPLCTPFPDSVLTRGSLSSENVPCVGFHFLSLWRLRTMCRVQRMFCKYSLTLLCCSFIALWWFVSLVLLLSPNNLMLMRNFCSKIIKMWDKLWLFCTFVQLIVRLLCTFGHLIAFFIQTIKVTWV